MRQTYARPEVSKVELVLDQQVLTACKVYTHEVVFDGTDCASTANDCIELAS